MMPEKVTIADVARRANVSRQTVSNVLNSPDLVREETRERVRQAVEELGYRVNQAARRMRTGRSRLLAVRIEQTQDGMNVFDRFLHGLTESAAKAGYRVILYSADDDRSEIATFDDLLGAYEPDAFVLTGTHYGDVRTSWLAERGLAFVTFGRPWGMPEGGDHPWVDVDGAAGTAAATRHLLDAGHRRIGFIGWPEGSGVGDDRRSGWVRALGEDAEDSEAGVLERRTDGSAAEGEAAARELIAAGATALVCVSDSVALGAMQAGPVPVIGFDDTPVAAAIGLTSLSQPLSEAAVRCVRVLTRLLEDDSPDKPDHVLLRPSLVIRRTA
ncbi:LacI family DNA-binding transcriptional regulator [Nonomuraea aurantiaca]|jgi:DNA-binding LacI/PurR family transcriptional regulator|uniref:LacI family DNA-binding transcriptional regulator n=1 Tax=Nonomuraea aurantiaca TaxID=2878562 RepID=UPI001CD9A27B|nr:LacI family DNA-binding transcriptional regulator [Nonomuraea aurantiaca]MCA2226609.1 LacI family transcriptional regulator [Nonomuraea aurantiaca]